MRAPPPPSSDSPAPPQAVSLRQAEAAHRGHISLTLIQPVGTLNHFLFYFKGTFVSRHLLPPPAGFNRLAEDGRPC